MACIIILIGAVLFGQLTAGLPIADDSAGHIRSGLIFAQRMLLLSCHEDTLLPEVADISKRDCAHLPPDINSKYESLIAALDKVLHFYDLQEKLLQSQIMSTETRALQIIIDTVVNQTCDWVRAWYILPIILHACIAVCYIHQVESLGMRYSGSNEVISCSSGHAEIEKLHTLISTYKLVNEARISTKSILRQTLPDPSDWPRASGIQHDLSAAVNGTDYAVLLTNRPCMPCM